MTVLDSTAPPDSVANRIWHDLLAADLPRYQQVLDEALAPQQDYLTDTEHAVYRIGKRLRPAVLLLSARMVHGSGPLPPKAVQGAVSLEMLHVATLIHDDVVDGSMLRRGMPSVNAARGMEKAVIVGDLQFVQAIRGFVGAIDRDRDMTLVQLVLDTAFEICCGELDEMQTDLNGNLPDLLDRYWRTADRKTAVLFGLAAESGISLAGGRSSAARRAGFYGRRIGRAFQVMDDLFDLAQDESASGKPLGMDLVSRRSSLPLLYAMDELGPDHRVSRIMRGAPVEPGEPARLIPQIRCTTGFARAYADARAQALDAIELLRPFPQSPYRYALEDLALHIVDRAP